MALSLRKPIQLAAIDAGSNAFRLMIARIHSADDWEIVESVRAPVRLGHSVFTSGEFDRKTLREQGEAAERQKPEDEVEETEDEEEDEDEDEEDDDAEAAEAGDADEEAGDEDDDEEKPKPKKKQSRH